MEQVNLNEQSQVQNISTKDWMITTLIAAIPVVGFVMLFVWGFSGNTPASKANWAKASLLWLAIGIVLSLFFVFVLGVGSALFAGAID